MPLLDLLLTVGEGPEREEIGNVLASIVLEHARPGDRAGAVESRLSSEKDPGKRAALLAVLGKIGEDRTLPVVREALADADPVVTDAAVRAIAGWPSAAARDDALRIARSFPGLVHRVLAIEGLVRMIVLEPFRAPEGAVASLKEALALAERPEEKRLVLGALPLFACPNALAFAESLMGSADIGEEARAAAVLIRESLGVRAP